MPLDAKLSVTHSGFLSYVAPLDVGLSLGFVVCLRTGLATCEAKPSVTNWPPLHVGPRLVVFWCFESLAHEPGRAIVLVCFEFVHVCAAFDSLQAMLFVACSLAVFSSRPFYCSVFVCRIPTVASLVLGADARWKVHLETLGHRRCWPAIESKRDVNGARKSLHRSCVFSRDSALWLHAVQSSVEQFFALVAREINDWTYHQPSWAFQHESRLEIGAAAGFGIWRACHLLVAFREGLVRIVPRGDRRQRSHNLQRQSDLTSSDVAWFRSSSRQARSFGAAEACEKYLNLVASNQGEAERFFHAC